MYLHWILLFLRAMLYCQPGGIALSRFTLPLPLLARDSPEPQRLMPPSPISPLSASGANAMVLWAIPKAACKAALPFASSAGVLGLFVAGIALPRLFRKPLEVACLAPFVLSATIQQ